MQRSHRPTTWRHPKENDTMGSTYSWGNLAPWQVWGCVAIAEKGHLTLWLALSGCQVGKGAKEGKKQWDFLFLKSEFKAPHLFVPYSLILPVKSNEVIIVITIKLKKKKTSKTEITEQIIFSAAQKKASLYFSVVVKYYWVDNICRLKVWIDVFIFAKITLTAKMHISETCPVYSNWICLALFAMRVQWVLQVFCIKFIFKTQNAISE